MNLMANELKLSELEFKDKIIDELMNQNNHQYFHTIVPHHHYL